MRRLILLPLLWLAACGTTEPLTRPVPVSMPVAVPCHFPEIAPYDWPLQKLPANAALFDGVKTALAELDLRKAYEARLNAALAACR